MNFWRIVDKSSLAVCVCVRVCASVRVCNVVEKERSNHAGGAGEHKRKGGKGVGTRAWTLGSRWFTPAPRRRPMNVQLWNTLVGAMLEVVLSTFWLRFESTVRKYPSHRYASLVTCGQKEALTNLCTILWLIHSAEWMSWLRHLEGVEVDRQVKMVHTGLWQDDNDGKTT